MILKLSARVFALILSLILISLALFACGETAENAGDNNTPAVAESHEELEDAEEENSISIPDLPERDWGGRTLTFLVRGPDYVEWESQDIYAEEETGEPVNDAVYKRNAILEDRYNMLIRQFGAGGDIQSRAERSIVSGANDYQVFMCNTQETNNLALRGYLASLNELPHLDLSREYWDQNSIYGFTVEGNTLFMTGDLSVMAHDATWILMFNKQLLQDLQLDSPYDLVRNNKWTADSMHSIMRETAKDLNGDGTMRGSDDLFGLTTHDSTFDGLFFGMGMRVSMMENGLPVLAMNNERVTTVMEKSAAIMDRDLTYNADWQLIAQCFEEDRALFYGEVLQCVVRRRNMDTDFGVIPFPKLDESQSDFAHMVHVTACMVGVPNSMPEDDKEFAAFMLEAMAAESRNLLIPAYYTIALEGKFMRDEESKDMLDIILRTRSYDLGYVANWGNLFSNYVSTVKRGTADFASVWERGSEAALARIERDIESYANLDN